MPTPSEREHDFVAYLRGLQERDDRGALAALRRGLGKPPGTSPEMFPYTVPRTQGLPPWREDHFFLVAGLFALHPAAGIEGNIGDTFARVKWARGSAEVEDSLEKRFVALLNAHADDLQNHLRHAVALAKTADVPLNWAQLLADLRQWGHPNHYVQREWARSYWQSRSTNGSEQSEHTAADAEGEN